MPPKKKIYEIKSVNNYVTNKMGELAFSLVCIGAESRKHFLEDDLAKKVNIRVADVRSALNKLNYYGIALYGRKKNTKTGWVTYKWNFDKKKIANLVLNEFDEKEEKLKSTLKNIEGYEIYCCKENCKQIPFELAAEYNFRCPVCNKMLDRIDAKKYKKTVEKEIKEMEGERGLLNKHI